MTSAEVFDPHTSTFHDLGEFGLLARSHHAATRLADGHLLITGGMNGDGAALTEAELLDPNRHTFHRLDITMTSGRKPPLRLAARPRRPGLERH